MHSKYSSRKYRAIENVQSLAELSLLKYLLRKNVYDQSFSLSLSSQFKLALTFLRQAVFQLLGEDYAHLHFPHHEVKYAQYNYPQCNAHGYLDIYVDISSVG